MNSPPTSLIAEKETHRLVPSRYSDDSVLRRLARDDDEFEALIDLDSGTNDRLLGEANLLPGISVHELLFGVTYAPIVNAAFTHPRPGGSRFNNGDRGAWYAALELKTAQAEIAFHKRNELREIDWQEPEAFTYDDYLADFQGDFHDLRQEAGAAAHLDPESYATSQELARVLLAAGSPGLVYPSVRRQKGTCIACFRPALVAHVRHGGVMTLEFRASLRHSWT